MACGQPADTASTPLLNWALISTPTEGQLPGQTPTGTWLPAAALTRCGSPPNCRPHRPACTARPHGATALGPEVL